MHRHATRFADRLAPPGGGKPALVHGMAGLMKHTHEGAAEVALVVARGDAHVVGRAAAERVEADVEPPVIEVEAEPGHETHRRLALTLDREGPGRLPGLRPRRLARQ